MSAEQSFEVLSSVAIDPGWSGANLIVFGAIAYTMTGIGDLPVAPEHPDFADLGKGLVIFAVYDLKTLFCKDIAIDFGADEQTNYRYNVTPLASLNVLAFCWIPGLSVTIWLDIDSVWGLLTLLVV